MNEFNKENSTLWRDLERAIAQLTVDNLIDKSARRHIVDYLFESLTSGGSPNMVKHG
jgi:hypothetical protein